ncbi:unnamed protein product, partial [Discosporangium mesarthrocarpum]
VRVSLRGKDSSDLEGLMLFQELRAHVGPVWTAAFSHGGLFFASAGQDTRVLLFRVSVGENSTSTGAGAGAGAGAGTGAGGRARGPQVATGPSGAPENEGTATASPPSGRGVASAASPPQRSPGGKGTVGAGSTALGLLEPEPFRVFEGHKADVVDLTWSRNDFLLSASLDKTARLWHTTQGRCLHCFLHSDIVTAVDFHPAFEHFFLSGCFDKKVRVWNIRDGRVQEWQQAPDMVTAARFSPDGQMIIAGLYHGQ